MPRPSGSITHQRPSFSTTRKKPVAASVTPGTKLVPVYGGNAAAAAVRGRASAHVASSAANVPRKPPVARSAGRPHVTAPVVPSAPGFGKA